MKVCEGHNAAMAHYNSFYLFALFALLVLILFVSIFFPVPRPVYIKQSKYRLPSRYVLSRKNVLGEQSRSCLNSSLTLSPNGFMTCSHFA